MSRFQIKRAVRKGQKARIALASPSGGGKSWTALELATVLAGDGKVLVIDTERGEASLYADDFTFETIEWQPPFSPIELAEVIREVHLDFDVVVVDSLSHFWKGPGGTLSIVDDNAPKGNSYVGWKVGTEAQDQMVAALTSAECHVIATMRSRTEYVLETNERGKQQPRKVGMAPVQRDDLEYEFTLTAELDKEHTLRVDKSRCSALADRVFPAGHSNEMATVLLDWLESAEPLATVKDRRALQARLDALTKKDRASLRPMWKDQGYDLDRLLASEVEGASALIAKFDDMPVESGVESASQVSAKPDQTPADDEQRQLKDAGRNWVDDQGVEHPPPVDFEPGEIQGVPIPEGGEPF